MIKNIAKGMIIGIANIIPGISGGTMAVSMGIYDRLIHCISHFFTDLKSNIIFLMPIALGMVIAIIASIFGIDYLFERFPLQTSLLFIGLILGSLPAIYGKVSRVSIRMSYVTAAVLFFAVVVVMALFKDVSGHAITLEVSIMQMVLLFLIGVIAAGTMVIPGVSGSMMLLLLGYYHPILTLIKDFLMALVHLDMQALFGMLFLLVPFGIGVLVGMIAFARLIELVFQKYPMHAYWAIIGLLAASPIAIILVGNLPQFTAVGILTGMVALLAGWFTAGKLGEME